VLSSPSNSDQIYHIFSYLLTYCTEYYDHSEDVRDLLQEVLITFRADVQIVLLVGYFTLNNPKNQEQMARGETTIIQKLCNLPCSFIIEKSLKEILFPTLICATFQSRRNMDIVSREMSEELLLGFIAGQRQLYPVEEAKVSQTDAPQPAEGRHGFASVLQTVSEFKKPRSQSISSTNSSQNSVFPSSSSQYFLFPFRFPISQWDSACNFIRGSTKPLASESQ